MNENRKFQDPETQKRVEVVMSRPSSEGLCGDYSVRCQVNDDGSMTAIEDSLYSVETQVERLRPKKGDIIVVRAKDTPAMPAARWSFESHLSRGLVCVGASGVDLQQVTLTDDEMLAAGWVRKETVKEYKDALPSDYHWMRQPAIGQNTFEFKPPIYRGEVVLMRDGVPFRCHSELYEEISSVDYGQCGVAGIKQIKGYVDLTATAGTRLEMIHPFQRTFIVRESHRVIVSQGVYEKVPTAEIQGERVAKWNKEQSRYLLKKLERAVEPPDDLWAEPGKSPLAAKVKQLTVSFLTSVGVGNGRAASPPIVGESISQDSVELTLNNHRVRGYAELPGPFGKITISDGITCQDVRDEIKEKRAPTVASEPDPSDSTDWRNWR